MKTKILATFSTIALIAITATANSARAADDMPMNKVLVHVVIASGFVAPSHRLALECEVREHSVNYRKQVGQNEPILANIEVDNSNLKALIAKAGAGKITSRHAPADIGNSVYTAYQYLENGKTLTVDLGSIEDSRQITSNSALEAETVKAIADKYCNVTD